LAARRVPAILKGAATMTTAEAREKLIKHGLTDDQAAGVVDVLEVWGQERAVTKDYLDARLSDVRREMADLKADLLSRINAQTVWITTVIVVGVVVQHFWK
jgi:hypothetical protein